MKQNGIILLDDHRLFRSGLKYLLEATGKYQVIAEASDVGELMGYLHTMKPHLIILTINNPQHNEIEGVRVILKKHPDLKILVISASGEKVFYNSLLDFGIKGFILKETDRDELLMAINRILAGETYFAQDLLMTLIKGDSENPVLKITEREKEILRLICGGLSNQEIASHFNISQRTVERHRTNLLEKTGSKNSIRLVLFALKNNLVNI
jgi:DNA-binding NarL/FixJ family response regulator